jgi:ubiquinone/menaquinone biosynthesis C-methylase UbiE
MIHQYDLTDYRGTSAEQQRTADLVRLMPSAGRRALDIGARDGHFSLLMAERFDTVVALDLVTPSVSHPKVQCVKGNAAEMEFEDNSCDFVFCAEVLEHIPTDILRGVCLEIERVSGDLLLIGVPFKQDIRVDWETLSIVCRRNGFICWSK